MPGYVLLLILIQMEAIYLIGRHTGLRPIRTSNSVGGWYASALTVFAFMSRSNLGGRSTRRSAGSAPLRILWTYPRHGRCTSASEKPQTIGPRRCDPMTALGQSRHSDRAPLTSGLPRQADMCGVGRHVSKPA